MKKTQVDDTVRANQIYWRMADWIWGLSRVDVDYDNSLYDKAKKLYYMMWYNAFTGPDTSTD